MFNKHLKAAGIGKTDSQGRVVDFHSLRHTFCTNLHLAGAPQREVMELMRHTDPRLTAKTHADSSLFALSPAVGKLVVPGPVQAAQRDAQRADFGGHLPSLAGTETEGNKSEKSPVNTTIKSLSGAEWRKMVNGARCRFRIEIGRITIFAKTTY